MFLMMYEVLGYGAALVLIGMVLGWIAYRKVIQNDKRNLEQALDFYKKETVSLQQNNHYLRRSNQACYDQGLKDGQVKNIKELGKAMLSDSYVLNNGTVVSPVENFYRPEKLGPRK